MENASKALLMAAEILIGVLVLSLGMYLYITFSSTASQIEKENDRIQIDQINAQYTSYENKEDITIYDVVTIANLAKENNKNYGYKSIADKMTTNSYIEVKLKGKSGTPKNIEWYDEEKMNELIENDVSEQVEELSKYKCTVTINPKTSRVCLVEFTKL